METVVVEKLGYTLKLCAWFSIRTCLAVMTHENDWVDDQSAYTSVLFYCRTARTTVQA